MITTTAPQELQVIPITQTDNTRHTDLASSTNPTPPGTPAYPCFSELPRTLCGPPVLDAFYSAFIKAPSLNPWTKDNTDRLFRLCSEMYLIFPVMHDPRPDSRAPPPIEELKDRFYSFSKLLIDCHAKHVPERMANQPVDLKLLTPGGKLGPSKVAQQPVAPAATSTPQKHFPLRKFSAGVLCCVAPVLCTHIAIREGLHTRLWHPHQVLVHLSAIHTVPPDEYSIIYMPQPDSWKVLVFQPNGRLEEDDMIGDSMRYLLDQSVRSLTNRLEVSRKQCVRTAFPGLTEYVAAY